MPEPYRKQLDTVPEKEKLNEQRRDYLNSRVLPKFEKLIGVNISKPGDNVPTNNGVPRIFILDEKDPARPRSLEEENVAVGSLLFWELAQKGRLFAYPSGQKEPVQLQLKVPKMGAPEVSVSEPLSTQPEKLASRSFRFEGEAYKPKRLPLSCPNPAFGPGSPTV